MSSSILRMYRLPIVFIGASLAFACGCEPSGKMSKTIDSTATTAPAIESTAETSVSPTPTATTETASTTDANTSHKQNGIETEGKRDGVTEDSLDSEDERTAVSDSKDTNFSARFFCWNIESEGSDPQVIAKQLSEMGQYDIYAFTEFLPSAKELFEKTLGENYRLIMSRSGYNDRLAIAFDTRLFELVKSFEIEKINFKNRYRSPMVAHLKDKESGKEFFVMNNHLARGKEGVRLIQAKQLVAWARTQLVPIVALGDYNLDYVFATQKGNSAFAPMLQDNVWKWIKPVEMIDTNWYDNPEAPDGKDDYPGSLLDFAFVSGPAKQWKTSCKIIVRPGDFPDDENTSDHRPFELIISN